MDNNERNRRNNEAPQTDREIIIDMTQTDGPEIIDLTKRSRSKKDGSKKDGNSEKDRDFPFKDYRDEKDRIDRISYDDSDEIVYTDAKFAKHPPVLNKIPLFVIVLSVLALIVIIFAFVMEGRANRAAKEAEEERLLSEFGAQAELDRLDWVEQMLIPKNEFSRPGTPLKEVNAIVIHNIGNPGTTAVQNRNFFANLAITQERHASSNFIVCLDGSIIQCVPVDEVAYASNDRNDDTISIEVCHPDDTGEFTSETYRATVRLTAWLCIRYDLTSNDIIRHYDVSGKECPRYFVDNENAWQQFKADVAREMEQQRQ